MGASQEPGRPGRLRAREPGGAPGRTAQVRGRRARRPRERRSSARTVPPSEGNEVRREGRPGVGALRCTGEAGEPAPGDPVEGRECRVMEPEEGKMTGTPNPDTISTRLHRIAKLAREMPGVALRTLAQHIDIECLREAYRRTRKDGAVGVDQQTAEQYADDLERNLQSLLDRAKSGMYSAPPVRRVHIPKGDGSQRSPIGIPTFEDKIPQRAAPSAVEAGYDSDVIDR